MGLIYDPILGKIRKRDETTAIGGGAVTYDNSISGLTATNVQEAIDELDATLDTLDQVFILQGTWDASSGVFPGGGTAQAGYIWIVSVTGTVDGVEFTANQDHIIALVDNASTTTYSGDWYKSDGSASTNLTEGTATTTTVDVNSDTGANATLNEATSLRAGVMSSAKFDEVGANTLKPGNATHTGEVSGSGALTAQPTIISNKTTLGSLSGTEEFLINDGGVLKKVLASNVGGGDNFANADLTLDANRTHDLDGNTLNLSNGTVYSRGKNDVDLNTIFGELAVDLGILTGARNTIYGNKSGYRLTSGVSNTLIGLSTGQLLTNGGYNVAIGDSAAYSMTGNNNLAIGYLSLMNLDTGGDNNIALGHQSGRYAQNGAATENFRDGDNLVLLGVNTRPRIDGAVPNNQIVIGANAIGVGGNNSATWGGTSMQNHYFNGALNVKGINQLGTSTALLVQNGAGTPADLFKVANDGSTTINGTLQINTPTPSAVGEVWTATDAVGNGEWSAAAVPVGSGGIYEGNGTVPTTTVATVTDTLEFVGGTVTLPTSIMNGSTTFKGNKSQTLAEPQNTKTATSSLGLGAEEYYNDAGVKGQILYSGSSYGIGGNLELISNAFGIRAYQNLSLGSRTGSIKFSLGSDFTNANTRVKFTSTGAIFGASVGLSTPSAELHVKGTGATSGTTALLVQNSASTELLKVANDGSTTIGGDTEIDGITTVTGLSDLFDEYTFITKNNSGFDMFKVSNIGILSTRGNPISLQNNSSHTFRASNSNINRGIAGFYDGSDNLRFAVGTSGSAINRLPVDNVPFVSQQLTATGKGFINYDNSGAAYFVHSNEFTGNDNRFAFGRTLSVASSATDGIINIAPSTTTSAHIKLDAGVAPTGTNLTNGAMWYNGTELNFRSGGVTTDLLSPSVDTLYSANGTIGAGRVATLTDSLTFDGGTTILKGLNKLGTSDALLVQDSDSQSLLQVANTGATTIRNNNGTLLFNITNTAIASFNGPVDISGGIGDPTLKVKSLFATSATTALIVQNSASTDLLKVLDDGSTTINGQTRISNSSGTGRLHVKGSTGGDTLVVNTDSSSTSVDAINVVQNDALTSVFKMNAQGASYWQGTLAKLHVGASGTTAVGTAMLNIKGSTNTSGGRNLYIAKNNGDALLYSYDNGTFALAQSGIDFNCRLQVQGLTTTSGARALVVENSGGQDILVCRNDNAIGLYGATPVVQATTAIVAPSPVGGGGTTTTDTDTYEGYTMSQVVKALRNLGILA